MRIGITGGVGSGKSLVLSILRDRWQAEVIEADRVARELTEPGGACYEAVLLLFGPEILAEDGKIDRKKLAGMVFEDSALREELNRVTHPAVRTAVEKMMRESTAPLIVYEAALPEEAFMRELCQEIWYVYAPAAVREERLMASRGYTREKCRQIMASQLPEEAFAKLADRIIENDGTPEETEKQLQKALSAAGRIKS